MATVEEVRAAAALLGARGGLAKSPAKTRAVRENAKLGGRPRKPVNTLLLNAARQARAAILSTADRVLSGEATPAAREAAHSRLTRAADRLAAAIEAAEAEIKSRKG